MLSGRDLGQGTDGKREGKSSIVHVAVQKPSPLLLRSASVISKL